MSTNYDMNSYDIKIYDIRWGQEESVSHGRNKNKKIKQTEQNYKNDTTSIGIRTT